MKLCKKGSKTMTNMEFRVMATQDKGHRRIVQEPSASPESDVGYGKGPIFSVGGRFHW